MCPHPPPETRTAPSPPRCSAPRGPRSRGGTARPTACTATCWSSRESNPGPGTPRASASPAPSRAREARRCGGVRGGRAPEAGRLDTLRNTRECCMSPWTPTHPDAILRCWIPADTLWCTPCGPSSALPGSPRAAYSCIRRRTPVYRAPSRPCPPSGPQGRIRVSGRVRPPAPPGPLPRRSGGPPVHRLVRGATGRGNAPVSRRTKTLAASVLECRKSCINWQVSLVCR